ncbi:MAG TPA: AAA family ATPase [Mycobacteriales bacterium]|nr:AAA family ATPase [Mycobacteriales bacterium]
MTLVNDAAVDAEQRGISALYSTLDLQIQRVSARLAGRGPTPDFETGQERLDYEAMLEADVTRLNQLRAAEAGLCFGRLDMESDETRYVGRIAISDEHDPLLLDWRAPQARPFYLATAVSRLGVSRRRHIRLDGREVSRIDDEVFDHTTTDGVAESALLSALDAERTGRMHSIVATIQAEQDEVIRSPDDGPLVVQGAPGTGKTVVALHRAAYLLYTRREQLSRRLVLAIGPNERFLRYIEDVLPSLGETGVALATVATLFPGVTASATEPPEAVEIKGRTAMAEIVARGVRDREVVPDETIVVEVDGDPVLVEPAIVRSARDVARRARLPHNAARPVFLEAMYDALAAQVADRLGADVFGGGNFLNSGDVADIRQELTEDGELAGVLDELWPDLTPQQFLADLLGSPDRLASAAGDDLTEIEIGRIVRTVDEWTPADVPLLDEAAELLGHDPESGKQVEDAERQERIEYAEGALEIAYGSQSTDFDDGLEAEIISAFDLVDAEALAERHEEEDLLTPVERALADRTWAYGHVIIDEAQELSEMDWRLILRRCPTRSMTVVGDTAQTSSPAGTRSWSDRLKPLLADGWQLRHLTVNYRTPAQIMAVATDVLADIDPTLVPPRSIRESGDTPVHRPIDGDPVPHIRRVLDGETTGTTVVIAPDALQEPIRAAIDATVLTARETKGLEFDTVVLVEPEQIIAEHGRTDLYIALTRPTRRLIVLHAGSLPDSLRRLSRG